MILTDELQIMAEHSVPVVKGCEIKNVRWYKVTPETVVVCHGKSGEGKVDKYDIRDVELSSLPPGYFDANTLIKTKEYIGGITEVEEIKIPPIKEAEVDSPTQENPPREIEWRDIGKSLEQRLMELSERLGTEKDPQNIVLLVDAIAKLHEVICR